MLGMSKSTLTPEEKTSAASVDVFLCKRSKKSCSNMCSNGPCSNGFLKDRQLQSFSGTIVAIPTEPSENGDLFCTLGRRDEVNRQIT